MVPYGEVQRLARLLTARIVGGSYISFQSLRTLRPSSYRFFRSVAASSSRSLMKRTLVESFFGNRPAAAPPT